MNPQQPPPGQPGYPTQPGGYPNQPGGFPNQPGGYPTQPGGYPTQPGWQQTPAPPPPPPPGGVPPYRPQPPIWNTPPENHNARNVVIVLIVLLLAAVALGAAYVATRPPAASLPVIIPTLAPEPTATAEPSAVPTTEPTAEPATEAPPTEAPPTDEPPTEPPASDEPSAEPPASGEPTTEPPATSEPPATEIPSASPTDATNCGIVPQPCGSIIPGVEDQGIVFGEPVIIGDPDFEEAALLVQNVSDLVKSYSVIGTFKNGDTITATATGFISNHLPGSVRTPTLFIDGEPGASDVLTVAVDSMLIEEPSTPEGDVAQLITFGPPTIDADDFLPSIDVEVRNGSDQAASLTVAAGIIRDGVLVGVATGFVDTLEPGQARTVQMFITGEVDVTDQLLLSVETVLLAE